MKAQQAYEVIFNELFETSSKLEESLGYCESDLETAKHLGHDSDISRYTEELIKTRERLEKVYEAMQFAISKVKSKTP